MFLMDCMGNGLKVLLGSPQLVPEVGPTCMSTGVFFGIRANLEVHHHVLDGLGSDLKFLLGSPQLVPEVSPTWPQVCSFECGMRSGS